MSSPNSQYPDIKGHVRTWYQRLLAAERPWLRQLLNGLMGETGAQSVDIDMPRLINCATSHIYLLILSDAPPQVIAPINSHVGRLVTLTAQPPVATDLVFLLYLLLRGAADSSSDDDSIPEGVRHMYT